MSEIESLLDTKAVGRVIGVSEITLRKWRMGGFGPPFIKLGSNVRYRLTDVDAWLTTRVTNSTSAADMLPQRAELMLVAILSMSNDAEAAKDPFERRMRLNEMQAAIRQAKDEIEAFAEGMIFRADDE